jgi:hypothetical protein
VVVEVEVGVLGMMPLAGMVAEEERGFLQDLVAL